MSGREITRVAAPGEWFLQREPYSRRSGPFMLMMIQAVKELRYLPPERTAEDYTEHAIYLVGADDNLLVRISRRRPERRYEKIVDDPFYGFFTEAYHLENGKPKPVIPEEVFHLIPNGRHFIGNGLYERTEVTDDEKDPYRLVVPPTIFIEALRQLFGDSSSVPLLPPEAGKQSGIIGNLMRNRQVSRKKLMNGIRNEYFPETTQGLTDDITNAHLIVTDRGEDDVIFEVSRNLGLEPHKIPLSKVESGDIKTPIGVFMHKNQAMPLVVTYDRNRSSTKAQDCSIRDSRVHKPFANIELERWVNEPGYELTRIGPGHFLVCTEQEEWLGGLLRKIGFDFLLTNQVRDAAAML